MASLPDQHWVILHWAVVLDQCRQIFLRVIQQSLDQHREEVVVAKQQSSLEVTGTLAVACQRTRHSCRRLHFVVVNDGGVGRTDSRPGSHQMPAAKTQYLVGRVDGEGSFSLFSVQQRNRIGDVLSFQLHSGWSDDGETCRQTQSHNQHSHSLLQRMY